MPRAACEPLLDRIFLHGIEATGWHGVLDFERREGQRFIVDVGWWIDTRAAVQSDKLGATLCYKDLHEVVTGVIVGQPYNLIETLADRVVAALFESFPEVAKVEVTVHKPDAPIGGKFADVGVSLVRHRTP